MTPVELSRTVLGAVRRAVDAGELAATVPERAQVVPPGPGGRGDYATNVALQLARPAGRPPREVAEVLRAHLVDAEGVTEVDITGPGFLNITLDGGREQGLVAEVLRRGERYGFVDRPTGERVPTKAHPHPHPRLYSQAHPHPHPQSQAHPRTQAHAQAQLHLHLPCEVRALVVGQVVARLLRSQGALVLTSCESEPDPAWAGPLGVDVDVDVDIHGRQAAGSRDVTLRPVPAPEDPTVLGRDAARWALLHPAPHDHPRITADHLVQREINPLFRVRYAHSRTRALTRNAAALGFTSAPGAVRTRGLDGHVAADDADDDVQTRAPGDRPDAAADHFAGPDTAAGLLVDALAAYPRGLATAAGHRAPDRLARQLVCIADAVLAFQHTVLPLGDEKPSAAHRARLALAEAAGTVLAGGLSLLGIDAPEHL